MNAPAPVTALAWTIDVCRYCGRLAVWPGCEHWQVHDGWTIPVTVRAAHPKTTARRLAPTLGTEPPRR